MTLREEYKRQRRRIQNAIYRESRKGYIIPSNILPEMPKKITRASINRLERITPKSIREKSRFLDIETGELITGKKAQKILKEERRQRRELRKAQGGASRSKLIPDYTDIILRNFEIDMTTIFGRNERLFNYIRGWYTRSINHYGREDFAKALSSSYEKGEWPSWEAVSNEELLVGSLSAILDGIGGAEGYKEDIMEAMEYDEEWYDE